MDEWLEVLSVTSLHLVCGFEAAFNYIVISSCNELSIILGRSPLPTGIVYNNFLYNWPSSSTDCDCKRESHKFALLNVIAQSM